MLLYVLQTPAEKKLVYALKKRKQKNLSTHLFKKRNLNYRLELLQVGDKFISILSICVCTSMYKLCVRHFSSRQL